MVNTRLCETARLAFFFASPRHFDFLDCETETSKCFECERETFRLLKFEPQIWFRAMRRYDNELACSSRSDSGERYEVKRSLLFIAFFTLHRSPLSERLEQARQ